MYEPAVEGVATFQLRDVVEHCNPPQWGPNTEHQIKDALQVPGNNPNI
jgi:hypothetical protein